MLNSQSSHPPPHTKFLPHPHTRVFQSTPPTPSPRHLPPGSRPAPAHIHHSGVRGPRWCGGPHGFDFTCLAAATRGCLGALTHLAHQCLWTLSSFTHWIHSSPTGPLAAQLFFLQLIISTHVTTALASLRITQPISAPHVRPARSRPPRSSTTSEFILASFGGAPTSTHPRRRQPSPAAPRPRQLDAASQNRFATCVRRSTSTTVTPNDRSNTLLCRIRGARS